jgi:adenylosuccinate synthase
LVTDLYAYGQQLASYIGDSRAAIQEAIGRGDAVILEGAQGAMLDVDFGTYPYVTSSSPAAGGACTGTGIAPTQITRTIGVYKAYCSRVGSGPFPTEMDDEIGQRVRDLGHEYGTTTGRPRRCGWFDAVAARYSAALNDFEAMAVTHLDVYDTLESLRICTSYRIDGRIVWDLPSRPALLERAEPVYEELPGWGTPTTGIQQFDDLPANAQRYLRRLEEVSGVPLAVVTVGAERDAALILQDLLRAP